MTAPLDLIAAERARQVEKFGHSPEADRALPIRHLPLEAQRYLTQAIEDLHFRREGWEQHAIRKLAQAGALICAAIDRIEAEQQPGDPI
ncbi:hypothetical protein [Novosphingobium aquae]|uniref:dATP/dGTP diphosphohydrolase N-terminal domain-containing protein n=1 Tax=Novosphingobium aquae TaxID=3133435 RepID=A0ABU8S4X9_9SPHN